MFWFPRNPVLICLSAVFLIFLNFAHISQSISTEEFITLTHKEKLKFDEFRNRMVHRMPQDYMKKDVYLLRWLRDSHFDVTLAERRVLSDMKWREREKIDSILAEDFADFDQDYKYTFEGCDKEGKPVVTAAVGDWDLRRAIITGKEARAKRFMYRLFEEAVTVLRTMNENQLSNATQFITVLDFSNFNLVSQGCPRCLPLLMELLSVYQLHYPGYAHKVMVINTPSYALPLWEIFKNLLDSNTKAVFSFYGKNSKEWQRSLYKDVDPSQLTKPFGGTKTTSTVDMEDLRENGLKLKCSNLS